MSRILVVEDDPDIAELLKHYLERASHEVEVLTQGQDAIPLLRERLPDLVILDRMLPGLDGLEICRMIRASDGMADLPVMMVTARAEESDRIVGLHHQALQRQRGGGARACAAAPVVPDNHGASPSAADARGPCVAVRQHPHGPRAAPGARRWW
jgi:CheY-like chemotaxis protein